MTSNLKIIIPVSILLMYLPLNLFSQVQTGLSDSINTVEIVSVTDSVVFDTLQVIDTVVYIYEEEIEVSLSVIPGIATFLTQSNYKAKSNEYAQVAYQTNLANSSGLGYSLGIDVRASTEKSFVQTGLHWKQSKEIFNFPNHDFLFKETSIIETNFLDSLTQIPAANPDSFTIHNYEEKNKYTVKDSVPMEYPYGNSLSYIEIPLIFGKIYPIKNIVFSPNVGIVPMFALAPKKNRVFLNSENTLLNENYNKQIRKFGIAILLETGSRFKLKNGQTISTHIFYEKQLTSRYKKNFGYKVKPAYMGIRLCLHFSI